MGYENLEQTVISDEEIQSAGDVEAPWFELVDRTVAPVPATDKASVQLYSIGQEMRVRNQAGVEINISDRLLNPVGAFPFRGNINAAADFPLPRPTRRASRTAGRSSSRRP